MKIKTTFSILLLLSLLTSCLPVTLNTSPPNEFLEKKKTIESFYGLTQEDLNKDFGKPEWVVKRDDTTYAIYEWRKTEIDTTLPIPVFVDRSKYNWYCLLLEFDENNRLVHHASTSASYDDSPWFSVEDYTNCLDLFKNELVIDIRPGRVIEKTKMDSEDNESIYEYLIVMTNNEQIRVLDKYPEFDIGECIKVLFGKLDVRLTVGDECP